MLGPSFIDAVDDVGGIFSESGAYIYSCNHCGNVMTFEDEGEGEEAICESCFHDALEYIGRENDDWES